MVKDRKEWCISRQESLGRSDSGVLCGRRSAILDEDVINHVADLFAEHGSSVWWGKRSKRFASEGYSNSHSPNNIFTKETDIMDVCLTRVHRIMRAWSYLVKHILRIFILKARTNIEVGLIPVYRRNRDYEKAPYRAVLTHGFVLDGEGRK